jgi:2-polyprenyl-3-methyl-5-hydroxy-6-metoxy-1,4-benzoquinol methylase
MKKAELLSLYKDAGLSDRIHMSVRFDRCPYDVIEGCVPSQGRILDFGCGHGLLVHVLAAKCKDREVLGLDPSAHKIAIARRSLNGRGNAQFSEGSLDELTAQSLSAVTIIDVLYLLPPEDQIALLKKIFACLDHRGVVVIKEIPAARHLKFKIAYLKEFVMVRILRRTLGERFYFRTEENWVALFKKIGYGVEVRRLNTRAPSCLFVCTKSP